MRGHEWRTEASRSRGRVVFLRRRRGRLANRPSAAGLLVALLCGLMACVYVPPVGRQFTDERRARIVVGETTRADVVEILGEPDALDTPQLAVYALGRSDGTLFFLLAGHYTAAIFELPLDQEIFRVLLHFDARDIVDRYEIEASGRSVCDSATSPGVAMTAADSGRELLFSGDACDALGMHVGVGFNSVAFSSDGRSLGAGGYKLVGGTLSTKRIWIDTLATGELRTLPVPAYDIAVFAPDLRHAAAMRRRVTVVDVETGDVSTVFRGHGEAVFWTARGASAIAYAPSGGEIATGGVRGRVILWDPATGAERLGFQADDKEVLAVAWSADDRRLATSGTRSGVVLWDARSGEQVAARPGSRQQPAGALAFSPDGGTLAIHQGTHVELWRIEAHAQRPTLVLDQVFLLPYFDASGQVPSALAFSPEGDLVAATKGSLVVYDVAQHRVAARVTPTKFKDVWTESDAVLALSFSPDGTRLATGSSAGVHLWPVARLRAGGRR